MVRWITGFLDSPSRDAEAFWAAVTGSTLSARRGPEGQFATLLPATGDAFLRVQVVGDGPARSHLDLHVDDPVAEADRLMQSGATEVDREDDEVIVLRSPAGLTFCLVPWRGESEWPRAGGVRHRMCLDLPDELFDVDGVFWSTALPRERQTPLNVLLRRTDGPAGMHLHLRVDDLGAAVRRHVSLGAAVVAGTTLKDPVGREYCLTA